MQIYNIRIGFVKCLANYIIISTQEKNNIRISVAKNTAISLNLHFNFFENV